MSQFIDAIGPLFVISLFALAAYAAYRLVLHAAVLTKSLHLDLERKSVEVQAAKENVRIVGLAPGATFVSRAHLEAGALYDRQFDLMLADIDSRRPVQPAPASIHYAPHYIDRRPAPMLPAPVEEVEQAAPAFVVPTFAELFDSGMIRSDRLLYGYVDREPLYGTWKQLYSTALCGKTDSGKTTTVRYLTVQSVLCGARLIVLDPHAGAGDESLLATLEPLRSFMLCEPAIEEDDIIQAIRLARGIGDRRLRGDPDRTPVLVCVDELTQLLNHSHSIKNELATILEANAQQLRKVSVFMLAAGQIWSAARTGGTSALRASFASAIVHRTSRDQARMLLPTDIAPQAEKIRAGTVIFNQSNGDVVTMQIPNCTRSDVERVARSLTTGREIPQNVVYPEETRVYDQAADKPEINHSETTIGDPPTPVLDARAQRALDLFADGRTFKEIISEVWQAKSGAPYTAAMQELQNILREQLYRSRPNGR